MILIWIFSVPRLEFWPHLLVVVGDPHRSRSQRVPTLDADQRGTGAYLTPWLTRLFS